MRELELDGIHDDGEHVILVDSDGERYTLRIDEALRAAVRRDRPALGMIQAADAAPLRPREIQAMLRAGRSAEEIAEISEAPLDHIRRYEGPVLAERAWTAQRARTFPVGRGGPSLDEVVTERLAARQASSDTAWDAWRRPDGTWTLELVFAAAGRTRQAHWSADLDNRTVAALDDEARWITDEEAPPEPLRGRGRLMAVKSSVYDLEADGSFDEEQDDRPRGQRGAPTSDHPAALEDSELDALNARRGLRSVPPPEDSGPVWASLDEEGTDDDRDAQPAWGSIVEQDLGGPAPEGGGEDHDGDPDEQALREHARTESEPGAGDPGSEGPGSEHEETAPPAGADESAPVDHEGEEQGSQEPPASVHHQDTVDLTPLPGFDDAPSGDEGDQDPEGSERSVPARKPARSSKSKRAAMPSWDEIVFGSKQD